jgi:hypothetical protein
MHLQPDDGFPLHALLYVAIVLSENLGSCAIRAASDGSPITRTRKARPGANGHLLVAMGDIEQARLLEIVADDLQADRQAVDRPTGIDMPGRPARLVAMV